METVPKGREQGKGPGRELLSSGMASGRGSGEGGDHYKDQSDLYSLAVLSTPHEVTYKTALIMAGHSTLKGPE